MASYFLDEDEEDPILRAIMGGEDDPYTGIAEPAIYRPRPGEKPEDNIVPIPNYDPSQPPEIQLLNDPRIDQAYMNRDRNARSPLGQLYDRTGGWLRPEYGVAPRGPGGVPPRNIIYDPIKPYTMTPKEQEEYEQGQAETRRYILGSGERARVRGLEMANDAKDRNFSGYLWDEMAPSQRASVRRALREGRPVRPDIVKDMQAYDAQSRSLQAQADALLKGSSEQDDADQQLAATMGGTAGFVGPEAPDGPQWEPQNKVGAGYEDAPEDRERAILKSGTVMTNAPAEKEAAPGDWGVRERTAPQRLQRDIPEAPRYERGQEPWAPWGGFSPTASQQRVQRVYERGGEIGNDVIQDAKLDRQAQEMGLPRSPHIRQSQMFEIQRQAEIAFRGMPNGPQKMQAVGSRINHAIAEIESGNMRIMLSEKTSERAMESQAAQAQGREQTLQNQMKLQTERHKNALDKVQAQLDAALQRIDAIAEGRLDAAEARGRGTGASRGGDKPPFTNEQEINLERQAERDAAAAIKAEHDDLEKQGEDPKDMPAYLQTPAARAAEAKARGADLFEQRTLKARTNPREAEAWEKFKAGISDTKGKLDFERADPVVLEALQHSLKNPHRMGILKKDAAKILEELQAAMEKMKAKASIKPLGRSDLPH